MELQQKRRNELINSTFIIISEGDFKKIKEFQTVQADSEILTLVSRRRDDHRKPQGTSTSQTGTAVELDLELKRLKYLVENVHLPLYGIGLLHLDANSTNAQWSEYEYNF